MFSIKKNYSGNSWPIRALTNNHIYLFLKPLKGLFNMCKIAHAKITKRSKFLLKTNNYLLKRYVFNKAQKKSYVFNTKCKSFNAKLLF